MRRLEGSLDAKGLKTALVVARFNDVVTSRLVEGALDALVRHGATPGEQTIVMVPGSWELPQAAARMAAQKDVDAVIALGCLLRGETSHYDLIAAEAAKGLAGVAAAAGKPVAFGVLTCDTLDQAMARAGSKAGNKGWDAALAAIEMASLYRRLA
jgi:6,7-dimethyl-8-ribityllumazine synthase